MQTENTQERKTMLVLGGTGKTGRRVVERLEARGLPTRVGSRSGRRPEMERVNTYRTKVVSLPKSDKGKK
jgi:nucleoside-diphosphate-sugar epimerase